TEERAAVAGADLAHAELPDQVPALPEAAQQLERARVTPDRIGLRADDRPGRGHGELGGGAAAGRRREERPRRAPTWPGMCTSRAECSLRRITRRSADARRRSLPAGSPPRSARRAGSPPPRRCASATSSPRAAAR